MFNQDQNKNNNSNNRKPIGFEGLNPFIGRRAFAKAQNHASLAYDSSGKKFRKIINPNLLRAEYDNLLAAEFFNHKGEVSPYYREFIEEMRDERGTLRHQLVQLALSMLMNSGWHFSPLMLMGQMHWMSNVSFFFLSDAVASRGGQGESDVSMTVLIGEERDILSQLVIRELDKPTLLVYPGGVELFFGSMPDPELVWGVCFADGFWASELWNTNGHPALSPTLMHDLYWGGDKLSPGLRWLRNILFRQPKRLARMLAGVIENDRARWGRFRSDFDRLFATANKIQTRSGLIDWLAQPELADLWQSLIIQEGYASITEAELAGLSKASAAYDGNETGDDWRPGFEL